MIFNENVSLTFIAVVVKRDIFLCSIEIEIICCLMYGLFPIVFMMTTLMMMLQRLTMKIRGLCSHVLHSLYLYSLFFHLDHLFHLFRYVYPLVDE